jgi:hypothetical protein
LSREIRKHLLSFKSRHNALAFEFIPEEREVDLNQIIGF